MNDQLSKKAKNQNIQAFVRLRPINAREKEIKSQVAVEISGNKEVLVKQHFDTKYTKKFTFDRAFGPNSTQAEVYKSVVSPLIEEVLSGYSCTVFAYGQTGTGKTFTMAGGSPKFAENELSSWNNDPLAGIIPRSINQLFDELRLSQVEFTIWVSYLELYNEELFDLLAPTIDENSSKIRIFDDPTKKGSVIVQGLEEVPVKNKNDVYKIISDGQEKRKTAATLMNAQSSRSHTVFSILVHIKEVSGTDEAFLKTGKLNLVDLAGSENISKAGNDKKERARETVNINQSLLTLGRVITALVVKTSHVPYRESKLTRLLQDSLGGRTKTSIIATISPGHKDLEETLSTLEYAHRAKHIMNKPEINQKLTQKLAIKGYTDEINKLRKELMSQREKHGVFLSPENYDEMMGKLDHQDQEIAENLQKLKAYEEERNKTNKIFDDLKNKYMRTRKQLETTRQNLVVVEKKYKKTEKTLKKAEIDNKEKTHLIEVQAKTEEILNNQAQELMQVAETTTGVTEKLHNVLEARRQIDNIIKTSAEQFNDKMKHTLHDKNDIITKHLVDCRNANKSMRQDLNVLNDYNAEVFDERLKSIKNSYDNFTKLFGILKHCDETCVSRIKDFIDDQSHQDMMQKQISYISNTYEKMHKSLSDEMFKYCENREQLDATNYTRINSIIDMVNNSAVDASKCNETKNNNVGSLMDLFGDMFQYLEQNYRSDLTLINFKERAENMVMSINENLIASLEQIKASKAQVDHINEKQKEMVLSFNVQASDLMNATQNTITFVCDMNTSQTICISNIIQDFLRKYDTQYEQAIKMIKRDFSDKEFDSNKQLDLIQKRFYNLLLKNEILDNHMMNLSETVDGCIHEISLDIDKYCCEELEVYRPSGETPVRGIYNFPKSLASTSPHERVLQRFRTDQGYAENLDNSIIELDESYGEDFCSVEQDVELNDQSEGALSKSKWLSEGMLSCSVNDETIHYKLTKSASAVEISKSSADEKENISEQRPKSTYDRNGFCIPIHKKNATRVLKMNNT